MVALVQTDMKKLIAYSSIAHMGFVTLGAFLVFLILAATGSVEGAAFGLDGAEVQMISHGLISGALFLCVGVMYDRLHTREISRLRRGRQRDADSSPRSWCCSRSPTAACLVPRGSSVNSW